MRVDLFIEEIEKNGKKYENMFFKTDSGLKVQVKYAFYNPKLAYRVKKEIEETAKNSKKKK